MRLLIILFFFTQAVFGQSSLDSVYKWTKILNIHPLSKIDTTSTHRPKNTLTSSGWHIDYYARPDFSGQIDLYTFIYNDTTWYYFHNYKPYNQGQIRYDSVSVFRESDKFLYLKFSNVTTDKNESVVIIPKKQAVQFYDFYELIYADYDNDIFIEYNPKYCGASNIVQLKISKLNDNTIKEIKFSKGICEGGKDNWCIDNVSYLNGILTVTATLTKKRTKKLVVETLKIEI